MNKKLLILNNIGTPLSSQRHDVKKYLREFLMDPKVIQISWLFRWFLVYVIISVFRSKKSSQKYQKIWTPAGSPIMVYTESFKEKLKQLLPEYDIAIGMRYQKPAIKDSLMNFSHYDEILFFPLYPQYSEATTQSAVDKFKLDFSNLNSTKKKPVKLKTIKPFWNHPNFIQSLVKKISQFDLTQYQVLVFSYHGLPESQIKKNKFCQLKDSCCDRSENANNNCYRAQCFQTTNLLVQQLKNQNLLPVNLRFETCFQSRLGRTKWIEPYTDITLQNLARQIRSRKVLVICPSFVTDCLETLEEILMENKKLFLDQGGKVFDYVPCLNDDESWARAARNIIHDQTMVLNCE